ncbi:MAG: lipid II flippase MurJ [Galbitalea sp.]
MLKNAWLIMMLPHGLITLPIMTPYFTRMSGHAHRGDMAAMRHDLTVSLRSVGLFVCLAGVGLMVMAYPFSRVFSHTFSETQDMAFIVIAYLVGLIPSAILFVIQRTFYAFEDTRTPFLFQTFQSVLFVSGALIVAQLGQPQIGLGIAVLTTTAGIIQTFLAAGLLKRRIGNLGSWDRAALLPGLPARPRAGDGRGHRGEHRAGGLPSRRLRRLRAGRGGRRAHRHRSGDGDRLLRRARAPAFARALRRHPPDLPANQARRIAHVVPPAARAPKPAARNSRSLGLVIWLG